MQGFIARRLLRNVTVAELARRSFSTAARLAPAGLLLVLVLWLPAFALPPAVPLVLPTDVGLLVASVLSPILFASWSILVTPLAAAVLARAAIRSTGGGRLPFTQVFGGIGS